MKHEDQKDVASLPLDGIKIVDLTRLLPGGFATAMLAEFGADVLKIEQPGSGDYWREEDPRVDGMGARFVALNRCKRSLTLNLKHDRGRAILLELCEEADILVEGFRPGTMDRLGLGQEALRTRNPALTVVSISAFGQSGPWRNRATHDLNIMGLAGALDLSAVKGDAPAVPSLPVSDIGGALMAVIAVLLALRRRDKTGKGQAADISMLDALTYCLSTTAAQALAEKRSPQPGVSPLFGGSAWYRTYATACGGAMVVGAFETKFWVAFCERMGCTDMIPSQFGPPEVQSQMMARLEALFATRTRVEWEAEFRDLDCCVTPSLGMMAALESPQVQDRQLVQAGARGHVGIRNPVRLSGMASASPLPAPTLGVDTDSVLADLGYDCETVEDLRRNGVV